MPHKAPANDGSDQKIQSNSVSFLKSFFCALNNSFSVDNFNFITSHNQIQPAHLIAFAFFFNGFIIEANSFPATFSRLI